MLLAVDCGNIHTVLGLLEENGEMREVFRLETNRKKTSFEYAASLSQILDLLSIARTEIHGVILASVVPQLTDTLQQAFRMVTGQPTLVVGAGVRTGLKLQIDDPGTVAADLVAAAVAAKNRLPLPAIIIDMGTATTVTAVNAVGAYIGGAIMPGVQLSLNALTAGTSLLPSIEVAAPKRVIASATVDSMRSGIIYGTAGALDGLIDRFMEALPDVQSIVATGELCHAICPFCRHKIELREHLVLEGLYEIWKLSRRAR